jgi:thiol-disulfide isomerase/thioredoxin
MSETATPAAPRRAVSERSTTRFAADGEAPAPQAHGARQRAAASARWGTGAAPYSATMADAADAWDRHRREPLVNPRPNASSQHARNRPGDGIASLDATDFEARVLQGPGPIAVEFMSYSCAHCAAMEPVLQQVAETLRAREAIYRVNVAVELDLASRYEIEGTPTLIMFSGGQEVGRAEGPDPDAATILAVVTEPFGIQ